MQGNTHVVVLQTPDRRLAEFVRQWLARQRVDAEVSGHPRSFVPSQERDAQWDVRVCSTDAERAAPMVTEAIAKHGRVKSLGRSRRPAVGDKDRPERSDSSGGGVWWSWSSDGGDGGDGGGGD